MNHIDGWISSWMNGWVGVVTLTVLMVAVLVLTFFVLCKMLKQ